MRIRKIRKGIGSDAGNISVTGTLPVGSIISYGGFNAPEGWMICDGSAINRETYSKLFESIGTQYGAGDGSTTFNLPDLRDKFILGAGINHNIGEVGGEEEHTLIINEMPRHKHSAKNFVYNSAENPFTINPNGGSKLSTAPDNVSVGYTGGDQPHNNMPPYNTTLFIIKVREVSTVTAEVVDRLTSTSTTDALSANQGKVLSDKIKVDDTYLTLETKTNKTWIDGKPIYRKTIQFTTTATGKHSIKHNISNLDTIIEGKGSAKDSSGAFYMFPMSAAVDNVSAWSISIQNVDKTYFYFFRGTNVTGTVISYVTLYYTKTTN